MLCILWFPRFYKPRKRIIFKCDKNIIPILFVDLLNYCVTNNNALEFLIVVTLLFISLSSILLLCTYLTFEIGLYLDILLLKVQLQFYYLQRFQKLRLKVVMSTGQAVLEEKL